MPQHVDMCVPQWQKPGFILFIDGFTFIAQMIQCSLHVDGIPQNDSIGHQSQRTQLIFLSILVTFSYFTLLSMTNRSGDGVSAFTPVQLGQDTATIIFIINIIKQIQCLVYFSRFDNGLRQTRRPVATQQ